MPSATDQIPTAPYVQSQACFIMGIQSTHPVTIHHNQSQRSSLFSDFNWNMIVYWMRFLLQGSFVASMTATLRQMDDYHYSHLINTFGSIRSDVVVSIPYHCVHMRAFLRLGYMYLRLQICGLMLSYFSSLRLKSRMWYLWKTVPGIKLRWISLLQSHHMHHRLILNETGKGRVRKVT